MSLGQRLAALLKAGFFRPLARPSAAVYIDCADHLTTAADEGGQVEFAEARALISEVLIRHPEVQLEEDEGGQFRDLAQRAGQFLNKLLEAHWIEHRRVSLGEQFVLISPHLRRLLRTLHDLVENRPAELKDFAATLRSICSDLLRDGALDPNRLNPEEIRQTVKDLLDRSGRAEEQMHAVETLILEHESAQRTSDSPQQTLRRFLIDFQAGEHMVCYDALQESALLPRIARARSVAQEALFDPFTKQRLAEGLAAHLQLDLTRAYSEAEVLLERLERRLALIPAKQRLIDGRIADFTRLSAARYRYQTEMRGRRPDQVKAFMDRAAAQHTGSSFRKLSNEEGFSLLSPQIEVTFGPECLSTPRRQRLPVDLTLAPATETDPTGATDEIRRRNLNILTPQRAARFVQRHLPEKGRRISTADLHILVEDDLLDLLAVLAFDRGPAGTSHKTIRWTVTSARADFGLEPERIQHDFEAGRLMERFILERIS